LIAEPTTDERAETQTLLDKIHRKNIYLALRLRGFPKLHMTLRYYAGADRDFFASLCLRVAQWLADREPEPFRCNLGKRDMFGPRRDVPVLLATEPLPAWVEELRNLVPSHDTYDRFRPHVSTRSEEPGIYLFDSVAVMHRKEVLCQWALRTRQENQLWE
jgi:2'-5' RNA ligase